MNWKMRLFQNSCPCFAPSSIHTTYYSHEKRIQWMRRPRFKGGKPVVASVVRSKATAAAPCCSSTHRWCLVQQSRAFWCHIPLLLASTWRCGALPMARWHLEEMQSVCIQGAHGKRQFSQYSLLTMFSSTKNQLKVASACNFLYSHLNNKVFNRKIAHPWPRLMQAIHQLPQALEMEDIIQSLQ
jgi:hypothetical protein